MITLKIEEEFTEEESILIEKIKQKSELDWHDFILFAIKILGEKQELSPEIEKKEEKHDTPQRFKMQ